MSKKEKILSFAVVLAIAVVYIGMALVMDRLYSKLFPLIFSSIVAVMCIIGIATEARKLAPTSKGGKDDEKPKETWLAYAKIGIWALIFFVLVWMFGFIYSIPLFIFAYTKLHGTSWLTSILTGVITGGIIWLVFIQLLEVYLYAGILFGE
ncbi:tripartite tricarboxylate transporter TctB family protein [Chloroflexota bacterium]